MKIDELVFQLQQAESFILAIDGMSTSGKTTLATQLLLVRDQECKDKCIVFLYSS